MVKPMNTATRIRNKLAEAGLTEQGIKGVLCNLYAESLLISNNVENRSGIPDDVYTAMVDAGGYDFETDNKNYYGYGLAQWTYPPRKKALLNLAKSRGVSVADEDMQADFLIIELKNDFPSLFQFLKETDNVYKAADRFMREFENPAVKTDRTIYLSQIEKMLESFWPPRKLTKGMTGHDVAVLQAVLKARGYSLNYISGTFDDVCEQAVNAFKKDSGLGVPGVVGTKTWAKLLKR